MSSKSRRKKNGCFGKKRLVEEGPSISREEKHRQKMQRLYKQYKEKSNEDIQQAVE